MFARRPQCVAAVLVLVAVLCTSPPAVRAHQAAHAGQNPASTSLEVFTQELVSRARQYGGPGAGVPDALVSLAAQRLQLLAALIEDDPGAALRAALPAGMRASLPPSVQAYVEQEVEVEGVLEVFHEDWPTGGRYRYFLDSAGRRYSLHFTTQPPTHLLTGSHIRIKGVQVGNTLALGGGNVKTVAPAPVPSTLGAHRTLVILVNFQDNPTEPYTVADAQVAILGTTSNFFLEGSYNQAWLTGDVVGWFTIALTSTVCDVNKLASQAQSAASASGLDLSAYAHYVYAFPQNACGGLGMSTVGGNPSQSWINGTLDLGVIAHELGHALGLFHSHALDCGSVTLGPTCTVFEYGNPFDAMGNTYPGHYNAFQKERLGWLNSGTSPPITTVLSDGTYTLETYELAGTGPKALKILKSTDPSTGQRTWYYVESRQAIGFDGFLANDANVLNGVLVSTGSDSSGDSSDLLDMTPNSGSLNYLDWSDPALTVGQNLEDPDAGVTITTQWVTPIEAAVTVRFQAVVAVSTDKPSYTRNQGVSITATVRAGGSPVANAAVAFTVIKPTGALVTGTAITGTDGSAVYKLRLRRDDPVGIYQVGVVATEGALSGSATTNFTVR